MLLVELVEEGLDRVTDLVHHDLLLLGDLLLLLGGVVVEVVLLLLKLDVSLLGHRADEKTLVKVRLELVHITLEFVAPSVDLFLDALNLGLNH